MITNSQQMTSALWRPLCQIWEQRIQASKRARRRFDVVRKQCMDFFNSDSGFMWKPTHNSEYFDGQLPKPKFGISINKAYEFVAIYGPSLFWQYPSRKVMSQQAMELVPEVFGDPNDPQVQQMFQMFQMQEAVEKGRRNYTNSMMENYLDWSQREQPSGLMSNAVMAITDGLLSGRGVLWPETYHFPGSKTPYTRLQFGSVANLYIDPDCNDPHLESAGYIMRRHVTPVWQAERMFELDRGSLESYATEQSGESSVREEAARNGSDSTSSDQPNDCIEWYEVWSRVGVGPRLNRSMNETLMHLDDVVGDYAYLCIAPGVPFPLNAPPSSFFGEQAWDEEQVSEAFEWRAPNFGHAFPIWKDNRWPVALLDFNPVPNSAYPIAPLAPGLGELIALNILTSSYVDMAWENRKTILGYFKSAAEDARTALESDEAFVKMPLNDVMQKSISDVMQILQRPESNRDILQAIAMMSDSFDKRVGLSELMYGGEGATQVRVAADIRERSARSSVRPDKMAQDVAMFITNGSQLEMFLASLHVKGDSIRHLVGTVGAGIWDEEFSNENIETLLREMKATVEASEVRRPNKERDTANTQSLQQFVLPLLQQYAAETGNTDPLNGFLDRIGDAMEMDTSEFHLPPWQPPSDPEQQEMQQVTQQLELQKLGAEVEDKQAGATAKQAQAQQAMANAAAIMVDSGVGDDDIRELEHEQNLRHEQEKHSQSLLQSQETHVQQLLFDEADARLSNAITAQAAATPKTEPKE